MDDTRSMTTTIQKIIRLVSCRDQFDRAAVRSIGAVRVKLGVVFLLLSVLAACGDNEQSPCEIHAAAVCEVHTRCDGGTFETCYQQDVTSCEVAAPSQDLVSADACAEAYADISCSDWRHSSVSECDVTHWNSGLVVSDLDGVKRIPGDQDNHENVNLRVQ